MNSVKKYWLEGIFDDDDVVYPIIIINSHEDIKELCIVEEIIPKKIICKWPWNKIDILCDKFVYCSDSSCKKKHYYNRQFRRRMEAIKFARKFHEEEEVIFNRVIARYKREGAKIIYE